MCKLDEARFHDDAAARKYLEATLWPHGPICPHCGTINTAYITSKPGLYRCAEAGCRKDFTVTVGTVFERSKIALHKWLLASFLLCSSKKGMSAHQLHRTIGVTYKTAWFMAHRLREAILVGTEKKAFGTIEGRLRTLTESGGIHVVIQDQITHANVRCFIEEPDTEKFMGAFRKRVSVYGEIRYGRDGHPLSVKASELRIMRDPAKLPSIEEITGIYA